MPKAYPNDTDLYAIDVGDKTDALKSRVEDSKWIVELVSLLGLNAAVTAIMFLLLKRVKEVGLDPHLAGGIAVTAIFIAVLFQPCMDVVNSATESISLKIRAWLRIPYDIEERHLVLYAFWRAWLNMSYVLGTWGVGLLLSELIKSGALGGQPS